MSPGVYAIILKLSPEFTKQPRYPGVFDAAARRVLEETRSTRPGSSSGSTPSAAGTSLSEHPRHLPAVVVGVVAGGERLSRALLTQSMNVDDSEVARPSWRMADPSGCVAVLPKPRRPHELTKELVTRSPETRDVDSQ